MARKPTGRKKAQEGSAWIRRETKYSIIAILLVVLASVLLLAAMGNAGPAGNFLYSILEKLFGWGYYLLPIIALGVAVLFIFSKHKILVKTALFGSIATVIFGLGLIDIIFPEGGGAVGRLVGALEVPFGYTAGIVLMAALMIASLLVTFNASIRLGALFSRDKESDDEEEDEEEAEVMLGDEEAHLANEEDKKEDGDEDEKDIERLKAERNKKYGVDEEELEIKVGAAAVGPTTKKGPLIQKTQAAYVPPPLSLLKTTSEKPTSGDLRANANIIKRTLDSFGIPVEMGEINIGPKVTRYTLKPAEGVKLTRITALHQDLALSLAAHPLRIEAPIPGKSLVGIEVPNKSAAVVRLGSLMSYPEFTEKGPLVTVLGRDVTGEPIFTDIAKMPHMLVAGATGSGKSIFLHSLLVSLIFKNAPATLRFIMIDPKRVELSVYDGIPHLVTKVITENKKAVGVFRWAISEMERRYETLLGAGARDIKVFNQKAKPEEILPYLVIVVDELADLMVSYGKEIEMYIVRLAQMARATGIHLVLATQRPSVEVITGLIKANITARAALQVASQIDSRTILDGSGAEKLLGGGDMLFVSSEFSKPKRIQGAYVSDDEIKGVVDFICDNNEPASDGEPTELDKTLSASPESGIGTFLEGGGGSDEEDDLYDQALQVVREAKKASASLLQRRLKVGYARAARLLDIMEGKGVIGPADGAKPRDIYLDENLDGTPREEGL